MIVQIRCDRCGNEVEVEGAQRLAWVRRGEGAHVVSWQLVGGGGGTSRHAAHQDGIGGDLCGPCVAEFRSWWQRGRDVGWADGRS